MKQAFLLLAGVFFLTTTAHADLFILTNLPASQDPGDQFNLVFSVDLTQPITDFSAGDYFGAIADSNLGQFNVFFGSVSYPANLGIFSSFGLYYFTGPQLYSGNESSPTFVSATYNLTNLDGTPYTLAISAVPEPSASTLFILGFLPILTLINRISRQVKQDLESRVFLVTRAKTAVPPSNAARFQ